MNNILVMTASIKVNKDMAYHLHIPENERLKQYIDALIFYITESNFSDIIFADWSWYDMNQLKFLDNLAKIYGKKLELLSLKNDESLVVRYWKGYWESKILELVINNSKIIKNYKEFFKVTWRYVVKNINKILINEKDKWNCFFKWYYMNWKSFCNTAFFKVEKEFFNKVLYWAWNNVNDKEWTYLEHIYLNILKKYSNKISWFKELPIFHWASGGNWKKIDLNSIILIIYKSLNKLWFFNL